MTMSVMMTTGMTTLLLMHLWQQEGVYSAYLACAPKEGNLGVDPDTTKMTAVFLSRLNNQIRP